MAEGAHLRVDGREIDVEGRDGIGPCLFDDVQPGMTIYDEEIFGPVLLVVRVESFPDAMDLIRANPYGDGAAIFTNDGGGARAFEQEVTAGMVGINIPIPVPTAYHSFGGWKASLFGDLHVHGPDGVRLHTRGNAVTRRWAEPTHRGVDLGFAPPTTRSTMGAQAGFARVAAVAVAITRSLARPAAAGKQPDRRARPCVGRNSFPPWTRRSRPTCPSPLCPFPAEQKP